MKRDEKNLLSRKKILDSALAEFARQGYGLSSVNTICTAGGISKGILYHYFKDKDDLYLLCVKDLFDSLSAYLSAKISNPSSPNASRLEQYFDARLQFFHEHPLYHKLFCDVVIAPPPHLEEEILESKAPFDALNIAVLTELLRWEHLRTDISLETAVDAFRLYQDFVNARYQMEPQGTIDLERHEQTCKRSLSILLYGVVEREEHEHES
ncbi:TetR/AcrR family transcriptional regulator [Oscillibacter sp.]|uniref:TetR/AcrR family transcriptional regulator n=1 Tax=Oscillibacter sp. TaxID=1945593 RepID=UPI002638E9D2|nr:TetR/AcrR family transcriptional regulator [Oscillibacter sp.]MDD3346672.1 TetR/AcrR family transcriptional regulator [Oscillibacter sp.]